MRVPHLRPLVPEEPVSTAWIILLLGIGCAIALALTSWRHRIDMAELGTVSQNWLSEQRAHDRHYSER